MKKFLSNISWQLEKVAAAQSWLVYLEVQWPIVLSLYNWPWNDFWGTSIWYHGFVLRSQLHLSLPALHAGPCISPINSGTQIERELWPVLMRVFPNPDDHNIGTDVEKELFYTQKQP